MTDAKTNLVGFNMNIDQNYLEQAVKQTVEMGIAESLNGKNEIVSQIVHSVLTTKVNDRGIISCYERENNNTLLDYYVKQMLTEEVKACMKELVEEKREEIRKIVKKELSKKVTSDKATDAFISCVSQSFGSYFKPNIDVTFCKPKED